MTEGAIEIEFLSPDTIDSHVSELAAMLNACIHAGANISFVLPHTLEDSLAFWSQNVRPAVLAGTRALWVAKVGRCLAGSVQLDIGLPPNQAHRAEVTKLIVHPDYRGRGIAGALMLALEQRARLMERRLITLDTANEKAERLYLSLGYERVGTIPCFAKDPIEDRYDATTIMFKTL